MFAKRVFRGLLKVEGVGHFEILEFSKVRYRLERFGTFYSEEVIWDKGADSIFSSHILNNRMEKRVGLKLYRQSPFKDIRSGRYLVDGDKVRLSTGEEYELRFDIYEKDFCLFNGDYFHFVNQSEMMGGCVKIGRVEGVTTS